MEPAAHFKFFITCLTVSNKLIKTILAALSSRFEVKWSLFKASNGSLNKYKRNITAEEVWKIKLFKFASKDGIFPLLFWWIFMFWEELGLHQRLKWLDMREISTGNKWSWFKQWTHYRIKSITTLKCKQVQYFTLKYRVEV